jgi:hypothetical protein
VGAAARRPARIVVMDCDRAGRQAAVQIAGNLKSAGVHGSIIELARDRDDGYDLTDWLSDHRGWPVERICGALGNGGAKVSAAA